MLQHKGLSIAVFSFLLPLSCIERPRPMEPLKERVVLARSRLFRKLDNTIHRINLYPVDSAVFLLTLTHLIAIYWEDSVNQPSNN